MKTKFKKRYYKYKATGEYGDETMKLVDYINNIWFKEFMKDKSPSIIYRYQILTRLIIKQLEHFPLDKIRPLHI